MSEPGYITDIPYTFDFQSHWSPLDLRFVALTCGVKPPAVDGGFRFLELGCGNGVTANVYAAANPEGEFHAVDFNAEHIANARALAEAAGLDNLHFHQASFSELEDMDLGRFDYAALHGVWSWVSPEVREAILEVLCSKLKPGGLVYISYNTMPGWAPLLPIRRIMRAYADGMELPTLEKVRHALTYLSFLKDRGSAYFANNAAASAMLDSLLAHDPHYIAHEYFNEHWDALYFDDVARPLAERGLRFVGQVPPELNLVDLTVPPAFREAMDTALDRHTFEVHKGFVLNEMFRRDVYVLDPAEELPDEQVSPEWDSLLFGLQVAAEDLSFRADFPAGQVEFTDPVYQLIADELTAGARTFGELRASLHDHEPRHVLEGVLLLSATGQVGVLREPTRPRSAVGSPRLLQAANRELLLRRLGPDGTVCLASPINGNGVALDGISGLFALALDQAPDHPERWAVAFLQGQDRCLQRGGEDVKDPGEQEQMLHEARPDFDTNALPKLLEYGIMG